MIDRYIDPAPLPFALPSGELTFCATCYPMLFPFYSDHPGVRTAFRSWRIVLHEHGEPLDTWSMFVAYDDTPGALVWQEVRDDTGAVVFCRRCRVGIIHRIRYGKGITIDYRDS